MGDRRRPNAIGSRGERETKYVFDGLRAPQVLGLVAARCRRDRRHPAGIVSSIYFDSPDWCHLGEKVNGDRSKRKVRLRWYADVSTARPVGNAFAEAKLKEGVLRRKVRVDTGVSAALVSRTSLASRAIHAAVSGLRDAGVAVPRTLTPVFEIAYARHRFVEPASGARLSVDTAIRVSRTNTRRLGPARPFRSRIAVVEVKGGLDDLPPPLDGLRRLGCRKQSFSKYGACFGWETGAMT